MLSGGQRTRLALARGNCTKIMRSICLMTYTQVSIQKTCAQINDCIKTLKGKTRILCSQDPKHLRNCEMIIELESGQISRIGTANEFLSAQSCD